MKMNGACGYPLFWRSVDVSRPVSFVGEALVKLAMGIPSDSNLEEVSSLSFIPMIDSPAHSSSSLSTALSTGSRGNIAVGPRQRSMGSDLRRLRDEIPLLRDQIRDSMIQKELAIQRTRVSTRWGLMKEWNRRLLSGLRGGPRDFRWNLQDHEIAFRTRRLHGNPEVFLLDPEIVFGSQRGHVRIRKSSWEPGGFPFRIIRSYLDPEFPWEPEMFGLSWTVLPLPRQDYYRYLFGSRILPLGSWPLSISYAACFFCRKPLSDIGGAGVDLPGVVDQATSRDFNVLLEFCTFAPSISKDLDAP
ncbi:hypothetical protein DY000_02007350 [Brassica cretica]|uniref:Uncharacterized protein n=1 Tax=Brassica cretica TaxID=69181 RepID=A0ABQ7C9E9_BRACR|nr:hypothetical protein DY000_02007350 [Brassica cretica]